MRENSVSACSRGLFGRIARGGSGACFHVWIFRLVAANFSTSHRGSRVTSVKEIQRQHSCAGLTDSEKDGTHRQDFLV